MNKWYNSDILKESGSKMLSLISEFQEKHSTFPIEPNVKPGFLSTQFPDSPPQEGTSLENIFYEMQTYIQPGLVLTNHPMYFAEMSGQISETTILSEIFINAFHTPGFSWEASPSQTELENILTDWFVELMNLPEKFLIKNEGGGTLSTSTTHSYFHSINVAKYKKMEELNLDFTDERTLKFVAYYPETNEKKAKKAIKLKEVHLSRKIAMVYDENQKNYHISYEELENKIKEDIENGLIPFWCDSSFGSEGVCNYDDLELVGFLCEKYKLALNVNANWGGLFLMLQEFKGKFNKGLEKADFIMVNGRYLMGGGYSSFTYFSNKELFKKSLGGLMGCPMIDLNLKKKNVMHMKDFSIGFGKRFNNFKFFFLLRRLGAEGIRKYLSKKIYLASVFEENMKIEKFIEIREKNVFGVVCFRILFGSKMNELNELVLKECNKESSSGVIGSVKVGEDFLLRVSINNDNTEEIDILKIIEKIKENCNKHLKNNN